MQRLCSPALLAGVIVLACVIGQISGFTIGRMTARWRSHRDVAGRPHHGPARNVILFIGDGMGDSEITVARNYAVGASGRLAMDTLPLTGAYTTYSVQEGHPDRPDYVPDSAATGTAWATGSKTSNGRISTSPGSGRDLKTVLEIAQERGYRTGDATTAELTDATPAVLAAHVASRTCQGPADMNACPQDLESAGGHGSIAEQEIGHEVDVLLGGGYSRFEQPAEAGRVVLQSAIAHAYRIVTAATGLEYVLPGQRVLGLFAPGNMTTEWTGSEALPYPGNAASPQTCTQGWRPENEPSLAQMTTKAIQPAGTAGDRRPGLLSAGRGRVNRQAGSQCQSVRADRRNRRVRSGRRSRHRVRAGASRHARDRHRRPCAYESDRAAANRRESPTGLISVLLTADKTPMAVSYGTSPYHHSQEHTGTQVRIAAMGPQAGNVVGVTDQTDLFRLMVRALMTSAGRPSTQP